MRLIGCEQMPREQMLGEERAESVRAAERLGWFRVRLVPAVPHTRNDDELSVHANGFERLHQARRLPRRDSVIQLSVNRQAWRCIGVDVL